ncbi:hypothetical protein ZWY2020_026453 [Hordeum vulgare]|nr:hypothetical protein ZWY2020_026453 [Hordeum vulgare]
MGARRAMRRGAAGAGVAMRPTTANEGEAAQAGGKTAAAGTNGQGREAERAALGGEAREEEAAARRGRRRRRGLATGGGARGRDGAQRRQTRGETGGGPCR